MKPAVITAGISVVGGSRKSRRVTIGELTFNARNAGPPHDVDVSMFPLAYNDGIKNAAGDTVVLYAQTNPAENGPWVVGRGASGAPLTRPSWWAPGATIEGRLFGIDVARGTLFGATRWRAFAPKFVVDVDDPIVYCVPRRASTLGKRERRRRAKLRRRARDRAAGDWFWWGVDPAAWWMTAEGRRRWIENDRARKRAKRQGA